LTDHQAAGPFRRSSAEKRSRWFIKTAPAWRRKKGLRVRQDAGSINFTPPNPLPPGEREFMKGEGMKDGILLYKRKKPD